MIQQWYSILLLVIFLRLGAMVPPDAINRQEVCEECGATPYGWVVPKDSLLDKKIALEKKYYNPLNLLAPSADEIKIVSDSETVFESYIIDAHDAQGCDDTQYCISINKLLFMNMFLHIINNHGKNDNAVRVLQSKVRTGTIMQKEDDSNVLRITQKDLLYRLLPYIPWNGCIEDELFKMKFNAKCVWVGISKCLHKPDKVYYYCSSSNTKEECPEYDQQIVTQEYLKVIHEVFALKDLASLAVAKLCKTSAIKADITKKIPTELVDCVERADELKSLVKSHDALKK